MRRLLRPATELAAAIAAFGLAGFGTGTARAQDDPFALPKDVTIAAARQAEGPGLTPIRMDGRELPRMVRLKWQGDQLAIDAADAEAAGLPVAEGSRGYVMLSSLRLAKWDFDRLGQQLTVTLFRNADGPNDIDLRKQDFVGGTRADIPALLIDYDLTATIGSRTSSAAAAVSPRFAWGNFQVQSAFKFASHPEQGASRVVRLDTAARMAVPGRNVEVSVGDAITAGSTGQRPLRLGGLQVASDFALRPDLVTTPLPAFAGSVAVPTGIDLVVNDQRLAPQQVEAGEFKLRNIPVPPGRGEFAVIVQDALGREVARTAQVYVSQEMLAPGLWQYGANMGWVRRRYGTASNDYGELAGTFFLRRGLTRGLSLGASGEAGLGLWNAGIEAQATIGGLAMAFGELRVSRSAAGSGRLLRAGVESIGRGISGRVEAVLPSAGYADLASQAGDPRVERQVNALVGFDLRQTLKLQVAASRRWRLPDPRYPAQDPRIDIARATLRGKLTGHIDFAGDLTYRKAGGRRSVAAMLGLSMRLGGKRNLQVGVSRRNGAVRGQAAFSKADVVTGDIGYAVNAFAGGGENRINGALAWRSAHGRIQGEAEYDRGTFTARANARGTLILAGGQVFARNQSGGAYALVSTGRVSGVTVTRENAPVGKTGRGGFLLVENVTPLVPMQYDVDAEKLPAEAVAKATYQRIVAGRGGVARVRLDVSAFRSLPLRLLGPTGAPLPIGTMLEGRDMGERYMVGYDGLVDFNALSGETALKAANGSWQGCVLALPQGLDKAAGDVELRTSCAAQLLVRQ